MILYITIFVIGVFLFLLYTPIILELDSIKHLYGIRIWGIASACVVTEESKIGIRLNVLGWKKNIFPERNKKRRKKTKEAEETKKQISFRKIFRKIAAVSRSFRVTYFYLNIDTDDYVINAWLYPLAIMLSKKDCQIRINFLGEVEFRLKIENSLQRMLRAYFR